MEPNETKIGLGDLALEPGETLDVAAAGNEVDRLPLPTQITPPSAIEKWPALTGPFSTIAAHKLVPRHSGFDLFTLPPLPG